MCVCVCAYLNLFLIRNPLAKKPGRVAFGSCTTRKMFPVHTIPSRMGIEQGLRGEPHRGPGCYSPDPVSIYTHTHANFIP